MLRIFSVFSAPLAMFNACACEFILRASGPNQQCERHPATR